MCDEDSGRCGCGDEPPPAASPAETEREWLESSERVLWCRLSLLPPPQATDDTPDAPVVAVTVVAGLSPPPLRPKLRRDRAVSRLARSGAEASSIAAAHVSRRAVDRAATRYSAMAEATAAARAATGPFRPAELRSGATAADAARKKAATDTAAASTRETAPTPPPPRGSRRSVEKAATQSSSRSLSVEGARSVSGPSSRLVCVAKLRIRLWSSAGRGSPSKKARRRASRPATGSDRCAAAAHFVSPESAPDRDGRRATIARALLSLSGSAGYGALILGSGTHEAAWRGAFDIEGRIKTTKH